MNNLDWRQHPPLVAMEARLRDIEAQRPKMEAALSDAKAAVQRADATTQEADERAFLNRLSDAALDGARSQLSKAISAVTTVEQQIADQGRDVERCHKALAVLRVEARRAAAKALRAAYRDALRDLDGKLEAAVKAAEQANALHDLASETFPDRADGVAAAAGLTRCAWRWRALDREALGFWRNQSKAALGEP